ncbi:hypothetical protein [Lacimonas salitolerans]|uniref:Glycerol-3-phosphate dehydrogenase n=1 Tax=Lacimonas salitolerans TaxID=1323750 RepID=A0ABW4EIG8_9RHOB
MSDPLKTTDIEDVLSSIRRLVSEEARPKQAAAPTPERGKLVLTPALRVSEPTQQEDAPEAGRKEDDDPAYVLEDAVSEEVTEPLPEAEAVDPHADAPDPGPVATALEWEDHQPEQSEPASDEPATQHTPPATQPSEGAQVEAEDTEATQDWSGTLYGAAAMPDAQDDAAVADAPDPQPSANQTTTDEGSHFDFLAEDDGLIDEEALRELVAEIVRQELQGALGERITRNVRKLVRREIHRALSSQEFD